MHLCVCGCLCMSECPYIKKYVALRRAKKPETLGVPPELPRGRTQGSSGGAPSVCNSSVHDVLPGVCTMSSVERSHCYVAIVHVCFAIACMHLLRYYLDKHDFFDYWCTLMYLALWHLNYTYISTMTVAIDTWNDNWTSQRCMCMTSASTDG